MPSRRTFVARLSLLLASGGLGGPASAAETDPSAALAGLEARIGGTLGVAVLEAGTGRGFGHRGDTRFPLCSTHKALSAAFVLARVDRGEERLDRRVAFGPEVLIDYSPVTKLHAGRDGMTVGELCAAAVSVSDNTAANLLLDSFGGPAGLTAFLRATGDPVTRLDRREPTLNEARAGDERDTTTPRAMAATLARFATGDTLSPASQAQWAAWFRACTTGLRKLRAGLPAEWQAGDKTGSGARRAGNDVALAWRPGRPPLVIAAYSIDPVADDAARDAAFAELGRLAATG